MSAMPIVLSMMLCDNVHRDATTGKLFFLGSFSALGSPEFPATFPLFFVCVSLTGGVGSTPVRLQVVDAREIDADPVHRHDDVATFPDRFAVLESATLFQNVTFPHEGEYRVQLIVVGQLLLERRLLLIGPKSPPAPAPLENP